MENAPVSQICAFSVLPSTLIDRVANSTPMVDFVSRLNSLRVNRESTVGWPRNVRQTFDITYSSDPSLCRYARLLEDDYSEDGSNIERKHSYVRLSDARVSDEDDLHPKKNSTTKPINLHS